MKQILNYFSLALFSFQTPLDSSYYLGNLFTSHYRKTKTDILFKFKAKDNSLCYYNKWDFDGDNIRDSIFFHPTESVHVLYYPSFFLSKSRKKILLKNLYCEFPLYVKAKKIHRDSVYFTSIDNKSAIINVSDSKVGYKYYDGLVRISFYNDNIITRCSVSRTRLI